MVGEEGRTAPRILLAIGVPAAAALVLGVIVTLVAGLPFNQVIGIAIAIFAVGIVPWIAFLALRRIRLEAKAQEEGGG